MACINCFFSSENQREIKVSCFGYERFEEKIYQYKIKYCEAIPRLVPISDCDCKYNNVINDIHMNWTNDFLQHLQKKISEISNIFDILYETYLLYISKSYKHASDYFWNNIQDMKLISYPENPIFFCRMLFRARVFDSSIELNNPLEYFHIPFNKREFIDNQRFSISGQPMLYLSNSIYSITKELEKNVEDLCIGAFLPNYSIYYYTSKIAEIKNHIFGTLVNSIPGLCAAGSQIKFGYPPNMVPNPNTIVQDIQRSILSEVLTFPTEDKRKFIGEYVLPQIFTTLLIENDYKGIIFPSTKNYNDVMGQHTFSDYNINIAFFTNYDKKNNYDKQLFDSFHIFLMNSRSYDKLTISAVLDKFTGVTNFHKTYAGEVNNNDYLLPLSTAKLQIEYLEKAVMEGAKKYFDTEIGKIELFFYSKLSDKMLDLIKQNIKNSTM